MQPIKTKLQCNMGGIGLDKCAVLFRDSNLALSAVLVGLRPYLAQLRVGQVEPRNTSESACILLSCLQGPQAVLTRWRPSNKDIERDR